MIKKEEEYMKRVAWAWAIALLVFGSVSANESLPSCPADIDLSNSAWVLRELRWNEEGEKYPEYLAVKRVFAFQENLQQRIQKIFHPRCWGETYSFIVNGHETVIAKRVVSLSGSQAFLLQSSGKWIGGSGLSIRSNLIDKFNPSYVILLFSGSDVIAHRKISLPIIFSNPALTHQ